MSLIVSVRLFVRPQGVFCSHKTLRRAIGSERGVKGSFKEVSRKFQGCFKDISRKFQGCFKEVYLKGV